LGYIPLNTTATVANFFLLSTTVINVTNDLYQISSGDISLDLPADCALVARIFTVGTNATATNAELTLSVTIQ
jgi:hypothetical protein